MSETPALLICMGVSGSGKSTVARSLAQHFGLHFLEADDFHGPENKAQMAAGKPLDDAMRAPWIERICSALEVELLKNRNCVMAYSGLRRAHRQRFRNLGFRTLFLHLAGDQDVIASRMKSRPGHFMPHSLLASQFLALEPIKNEPDVVAVSINPSLDEVLVQAKRQAGQFLQGQATGTSS